MGKHSTLRASDADREHVAERLRKATAEGRLLAEELEDRLGAVFSARTYGELEAQTADLPGTVQRRKPSSLRPWILPAVGLAIAIPLALAVIAAVLFIVTSLFAVWMLWVVLGWWFLGHRRGRYLSSQDRLGRSWHACGGRWRG